MSGNGEKGVARRPLLAGLLGVLGLGIAGGLVYEVPRFSAQRYPRTKFDDLLGQLGDRESAAKLGAAMIAEQPGFVPEAAARAVREGAGQGSIARAVNADIAQGHLTEVHGWVLPTTLVLVSGIAAKAA